MNRADLIVELLQELFVVDSATETPAPEDVAVIGPRIDSAVAYLGRNNVCWINGWPDAVSDDGFVEPLIAYLTQVLAPKFGRPRDMTAMAAASAALGRLQRLGTGTGGNLRVDRGLTSRRRYRPSRPF